MVHLAPSGQNPVDARLCAEYAVGGGSSTPPDRYGRAHVTGPQDVRAHPRAVFSAAALLLAISLSGCGLTIPADPDGTLQSVTGSELRVGVSADPGLVDTDRETPTGSIPDLVTGFADGIDAEVDWTNGSEETLVGMLERGDLDLVVGGFTADTPWVDRAGVTRGYPGIDGAEGREIVMLVPLGENAFLSELERYLDEEANS